MEAVLRLYPEARTEETLWPQVKQALIGLLYDHKRPECAETFYNSVACRVLDRTYYRNEYIFWRQAVATEFIETDDVTGGAGTRTPGTSSPPSAPSPGAWDCRCPSRTSGRDLRKVMIALRERLPGRRERQLNFQVQVLSSLFFRNKGAYVVGRLVNGNQQTPFVACHAARDCGRGLVRGRAAGRAPSTSLVLFSLARAYFMVDMEVPSGLRAVPATR